MGGIVMNVLLLGVGLQGKAALYDLIHSPQVADVTAADWEAEALRAYVRRKGYGDRVRCEHVDASSAASLDRLISLRPDVVIDLMPVMFHDNVAGAAVRHGVHLVNASYATPRMAELAAEARQKGVTMLPEFGMDPGIDLVLVGEAVRSFDEVDTIITYGAGFPEREAADNPLKYKVTWTFDGVLRSYLRAGRVIREGEVVDIAENEMFAPEHVHELELDGLGKLEAFPNGDALKYARHLGIPISKLQALGRYVLRWPGHCALWKTWVDLGFLSDEPLVVDGVPVNRRRFLASLLQPQIHYREHERDVVVVRIDVTGTQDGTRKRVIHQVVDFRDLETGFTAMSRTVGYTASIGAQMVGLGRITQRGLLSPVSDVPYATFVRELAKRGIHVTVEETGRL
jgi:lysine 6-dehydrogenase